MAESMGIFFLSNSSVRVSLVSFSLSLSLLRALGWGCSLGFCLLLREMAAGVLVGLVVGFLCRVFFFFPLLPLLFPSPHLCLGCGSAANRGGARVRRGAGAARQPMAEPARVARRALIGWRWHHPAAGAAAAGQGRELPGEAKGENGRHDLSAREDSAGRVSPKSWRKGKQDQAWASPSQIVPGLCWEERETSERGATRACLCNCVSTRWRRVSLEREGSCTSAGGHVTVLHSCGVWLRTKLA